MLFNYLLKFTKNRFSMLIKPIKTPIKALNFIQQPNYLLKYPFLNFSYSVKAEKFKYMNKKLHRKGQLPTYKHKKC